MRDYLELFATFSKLGLFTFGGGLRDASASGIRNRREEKMGDLR